jgi:hypothetical protein
MCFASALSESYTAARDLHAKTIATLELIIVLQTIYGMNRSCSDISHSPDAKPHIIQRRYNLIFRFAISLDCSELAYRTYA